MSLFGAIMAKVTVIGATGKVGQFAAYSVSRIPFVTNIVLFGREGNEDVLEGTKCDFIDSFAALGRNLDLEWSINPEDLRDSDIVIINSGFRDTKDRTESTLQKRMLKLLRIMLK